MTIAATDLLDAARVLRPKIAAASEGIDRELSIPDDLITEVAGRGLFAMGVPTAVGGGAVPLPEQMEIIEELSAGDGSFGWLVMIASQCASTISRLPSNVVEEIFAGGVGAPIAGNLAPQWKAERREGGYLINGRWQFASGCERSRWMCVGFRADPVEPGAPTRLVGYFPRTEATILDNWRAVGLRGTGSHDFELHDLFIPSERVIVLGESPSSFPDTLFRLNGGAIVVASTQCAHALGMARGAMDAFAGLPAKKRSRITGAPLSGETWAHDAFGLATARLEQARTTAYAAIGSAWESAEEDRRLSIEERSRLRLTMTHAARTAGEVIDGLYEASGSDGLFDASPLGRFYRDWHTAKQHSAVSPANYGTAGRVILGIDLAPPGW